MTEAAVKLTRRQFGKAAGPLVLAFTLVPGLAGAQAPRLPGSLTNNRMLDAWLRINADGSVTIFTGEVELGQGISTALAQIAADELDLPLARVEMILPDEDYTYGELAAGLDLRCKVTATAALKPLTEQKIIGRSVPRRDIPAKVTGGAAYLQDIRLSGMVHGRVVRPPRYGIRLDNLDDAAARAVPGVVAVVRDGSFLGVVTEREEQAIKARDWSGYPILTTPEVPEIFVTLLDRNVEKPLGAGEASQGPMAAAFANATGHRLRDLPFSPERVQTALG